MKDTGKNKQTSGDSISSSHNIRYCNIVLAFGYVDEILKCGHANECC